MSLPPADAFGVEIDLRQLTPARVALGRTGPSLPTSALLAFGLDHACARDAVHADFDDMKLAALIKASGQRVLCVRSQVADRSEYLKRPDLGRVLDTASRDLLLQNAASSFDCAIIIGDGLSPGAVMSQARTLVDALKTRLGDLTIAPIVIARGARVALGDEIAMLLKARLAIMLIGERPGLSTPESLGAYLTFDPRQGLTDADRNCVSNIHRSGLSPEAAASRIAWLTRAALSRRVTGVALKDESSLAALPIKSP